MADRTQLAAMAREAKRRKREAARIDPPLDYVKVARHLRNQRGHARPFLNITLAEERALAGWLLGRRSIVATMQASPDGSNGRPIQLRSARLVSVNAQEVRASERWVSGKQALIESGADFDCYIIRPDGSRERFIPPETNRKRGAKDSARDDAAEAYAARLASFGSTADYD